MLHLSYFTEIKKEEYDINVVPESTIQSQERKHDKILFERFRPSSSPIFPPAATIKSDSVSESIKAELYKMKHYHTAPSSMFSGTPIISDSFGDVSHQSSIGTFPGNFRSFEN